ncbi:MAG: TonB family protein [Brevundimonas sp.]
MAAAMAGAVSAQTWTPVAEAPRNVVAVSAEWASGVQMIARCTGRRDLEVMMTLGQPVVQPHVAINIAMGDAEPKEQRWRLSEDGTILFARQPSHLSRSLLHHQDVVIELMPEAGPRHRYDIDAPSGTENLLNVLTSCRHPTTAPSDDSVSTTSPEWLRRPSGEDLARLYPREAATSRTPGEARMECRVSASGHLEDCIILSESPPGMGFGAATIALAPNFRMTPIRANGHAHSEALIQMPIGWRIQ